MTFVTCQLCGQETTQKRYWSDLLILMKIQQTICQSCQDSFEKISDQHCPRCYKEGENQVCADCRHWEEEGYQVDHISLYRYNAGMKDFFKRYKFQGDYVLKRQFGSDIRQALKGFKDYTLIPVPVSQETFAQRGFNQIEGFLRETGLPYLSCLDKAHGKKQSSKNRQERLSCPQEFSLKEGVTLPEKVILVDDIYTTGATLRRLHQLFTENGVKEIKTFSLAR